jgi:VWFA-related protein
MNETRVKTSAVVASALSLSLLATGVSTQNPQIIPGQPRGQFRSGIVMVPVDVRVLDRHGNPVTNLTAADFTVLENEVRQEIGHFSTQLYTALTPEAGAQPVLRQGPGLETSPLTHRTFLIVLGRGRLQGPSKGMDAVIDFVRTQLLPQDHAAVVAYWRASDLTTDRDSIVRFLERYRDRHASIEAGIDHWRGDSLQFRSPTRGMPMPRAIRADIDALFDAPELPELRELRPRNGAGPRNVSQLYVALRPSILLLLAGIEHLRHLEGEKHLIFLTQEGLFQVGRRAADHLSRIAADSRVAVSVVQTAGLPLKWAPSNLASRGPWSRPIPPGLVGRSFSQLWAAADGQAVVEQTGGIASFYQYADKTLDRLNRATRFHYLLGYYPTDATWDGKYRKITVKVNRPDVTVLYRHGYYAQHQLVPFERQDVMAYDRMEAAATSRSEIRDIPVRVSASPVDRTRDHAELRVEVTVVVSGVTFVRSDDDRYIASLDVAVFVGDVGQKLIGETWERLDLKLDSTAHARVLRDGVVHSSTIRVAGRPRHVKAVVYDSEADRLGRQRSKVT